MVVRPGMLTDDQGSGLVTLAHHVPRAEIPREDVAEVLFESLRVPAPANHVFEVVAGPTPVPDALP